MKPFLTPSLILLAVFAGCAHISQKENHQSMSTNSREGHFDYVEFPAQSAESFAAAKGFFKDVFGWSFQE